VWHFYGVSVLPEDQPRECRKLASRTHNARPAEGCDQGVLVYTEALVLEEFAPVHSTHLRK